MRINLSKNSAKFLLAILLSFVAIIIYLIVNKQLQSAVQTSSEAGNAVLTHVFVNESWSEIGPLLPKPGADQDEIRQNKNIKLIDAKVRRFTSYTDIVKVKLYNIKGFTIYSSDPKQIGEDKSKNSGFLQAVRGNLASELTYRGQFGSFDGEIYNRNLVSTYAPIRDGYQIVAVAEIYSDRTSSIAVTNTLLNQFIAGLCLVLLALYFVILWIIKGSDSVTNSLQNSSIKSVDSIKNPSTVIDCESRLTLLEFYLGKSSKLVHFVGLMSYLINRDKLSFRSAYPKLANISSDATSNFSTYKITNQILNHSYKVNSDIFDKDVFFDSLLEHINAYSNIDSKLVSFYKLDSLGPVFYQDVKLINGLVHLLIDILSVNHYKDRLDIKLLSIQGYLQLTIICDVRLGDSESSALENLEFYKNILANLTEHMGIKGELHTSDKSTVITLELYPLQPPPVAKRETLKCLICLESDDELEMVSTILAESAIEFEKCEPNEDIVHLVRKNLFSHFIFDSDALLANKELQEKIELLVAEDLLLPSRILVINHRAGSLDKSSGFIMVEIPFDASDLLRQLS